jgi:hypothetical protein
VFTIDLLPAQRGDCLWLTYGEPPDLHHVIVDAGPSETIQPLISELERRVGDLRGRANRIELLTMTHIDADHLQGVVSLLSEPRRLRLFRDLWFNGFEHLPTPLTLGAPDGERLTALLETDRRRWNRSFGGGPVVVPDEGDLPRVKLKGGLELTLLSPTPEGLANLVPKWKRECEKAGLIPGKGAKVPRAWQREGILGFNPDDLARLPYAPDHAAANGSSIAFIARYGNKSVLCAADAHAEVLEAGLDRLGPGPHTFTAVKLSHHGSSRNLSPGLLARIRSKHWLVSTNGAKFHHPDLKALARVIVTQSKPTFHLNYVTKDVEDLIENAGTRYSVRLPKRLTDGGHEAGILVELS